MKRLAFAVFAIAVLLSITREWKAPVACARRLLGPQAAQAIR